MARTPLLEESQGVQLGWASWRTMCILGCAQMAFLSLARPESIQEKARFPTWVIKKCGLALFFL